VASTTHTRSTVYTAVALQYLAVLAGILWAWSAASGTLRRYNLALWPGALILSALGLAVASYRATLGGGGRGGKSVESVAGSLAGYAALLWFSDPFIYLTHTARPEGLVILVLLVLPPLLAIKLFLRKGAWVAACSAIIFSASATACLLFNGWSPAYGLGFSRWWAR
jgi:hypothetical protein